MKSHSEGIPGPVHSWSVVKRDVTSAWEEQKWKVCACQWMSTDRIHTASLSSIFPPLPRLVLL